jgi:hypothetical protein
MFLYSSINRGIYGHVARAREGIYSSVMCNRGIYSTILVGYM